MKKHTTQLTSKSIEGSGLPTDYKKAIAEYIWNSFDANASIVEINFRANGIQAIQSFSIADNGTGINFSNIADTFGNFMVSLKANSFSDTGFIKGKKGKGRYSFSIFCSKAKWDTTFISEEGHYLNYIIQINREEIQNFQTGDTSIKKNTQTGTKVIFEDFYNLTGDLLDNEDFEKYLANEFGWFLYLNKDRDYKIIINSRPLNYESVIGDSEDRDITYGDFVFKISFLRWNEKIGDKYYYYFLNTDKKEAYRKHTSFNNKTADFHHSVYIESSYFDSFKPTKLDHPVLDQTFNQSDPVFKLLVENLNELVGQKEKAFIRDLKAGELIESYNQRNIFPIFGSNKYEQLRKDDLENVVKELYSVQPKIFQNLSIPQSKTIVGFLNLLLDTDQREHVLSIIDNVVKLTDEERRELSSVLKSTKLSQITHLVRFLENRYTIVNILKLLVFDLKKFTDERNHIQKIIEENYWIFGEQYHLVSADKNFEILLNNYYSHLENNKKKNEKIDHVNKLKRPDIFIARKSEIIDTNDSDSTVEENIIVELKRPSVIIGNDQFQQVERYLRFIIEDDRFNSVTRTWKFILVGTKVDDYIRDLHVSQKEKGKKYLIQSIRNYEIYAMTWDDLFRIFTIKHKHLIDKLEFKTIVIEELQLKGINLDKSGSDILTQIALSKDKTILVDGFADDDLPF
ncbi:ATP-binding protein [Flavobacterium sp. 17A]|uniref:ATP-binding protein n=1 Tax=Flavobacterium potami TaxID=2872310 RepID=A0A9X1HFQ9_9FLAO|nr:ATP-binding protein [Flavobacterium potami]MBZ4037302.1 ATP-binding protein [Flavobacterium potami]